MERDENTERLLYEQLEVLKKQLRQTRIVTGIVLAAAIVLLVTAALVAAPAIRTMNHAERVLSELDVEKVADGMDGLKELGEAAGRLEQVDLERLNEAIQNLESATRPLAQLFGKGN